MNDLPLTILLVEDEPADADFLQEVLTEGLSLPWTVVHAERLSEAVQYLHQHPVDAVLLDLSLPDSQGVETITCVHELLPSLPIVVLTGLNDETIGVEAMRRGAQDYLVKGQIDYPLLSRSIRYAIERVRTRQVMSQQAIAHKNAEASLLLTRFALDRVHDAVFLANSQAQFFYVNEAACQLLGYSQSELLQLTVYDIDPNYTPATWIEQWQLLKTQNYYLAESVNQTKDGRLISVELSANYLEFNGQEFKCTIVRNISARKAAAKALEASERKFRTLVSNIPGIIYRCLDDTRWTALFISEEIERVLGYPASAFVEQRQFGLGAVVYPDDQEIRQRIHTALAEKRPFALEYRMLHRDGSIRWVREQGQGVWAENGHLLYVDGVIFDISSRRRAEAQILKLNRELKQNASQLEATNDELSKTKEFLASVLDNASDPIFVKDAEHRWILMNQKFCDLMGYDREALLGKSNYDFLVKEEADSLWAIDNQVLVSGESNETEDYITDQQGKRRFMATKKNRIIDSAGNTYLVGIIRDLTRRKQVEEALRDSEERFRQLAENIDDVFRLDDPVENRMIYISHAYETIWERSRSELYESIQPMLDAIHPHDREQAIAAILNRGHQAYDIEYRIMRPDGTLRWIRDRAFHIYNELGQVYRVAGIASDITRSKLAEAGRRESEARLQAFLDNADTAIYIKDLAGRYLLINHRYAALLGCTVEESIGKTVYDALPVAIADPLQHNDQRVVDTGSSIEVEETVTFGNQSCTVLSVKFPLFDHNGLLYAVGGISTDITMRKQAEVEILRALEREKELNELKSRFISTTSHEFRTPLTTILGSTELLEYVSHRWPEEKKLKHYQQIKKAVHQMTQLLEDVLTFSRAEAGKLTFTPVHMDIELLCRSLVEELQAITKNQQTIQFTCRSTPVQADIDEKLVRQILTNLISNALKYSVDHAVVQFILEGDNHHITFLIQDEGIGIPEADLQHLFNPFHRGKNVGAIAGTGLGLAIVKRAVELHGGTITVQSQLGKGTLCSVTLPCVAAHPVQAPA